MYSVLCLSCSQINELAHIARCARDANAADQLVVEYLVACLEDLEEVLEQNKAPALVVQTFGCRLQRLLR